MCPRRWSRWCCVLVLVAGVAPTSMVHAEEAPPTVLPPIEVGPGSSALDRGDQALGRVRQGLPDLGSEAPPPLSREERFFQWLFAPQDLNQASALQQRMAEQLDDPDAHRRKGR